MENMNKTGYRMIAWLCLIGGNFLAFIGIATNMWSANTIGTAGLTDTSALASIYTYTSILVVAGITLIAIGMGLIWHTRTPTVQEKTQNSN